MTRVRVTARGDTTSLAEWRRLAGQRLMLGLHGAEVTQDTDRLVREIRPGGYVLFRRNVVEPGQVRALNEALAVLGRPEAPPLRAVDQEGGRVQRVGEPFAPSWPAARIVGRAEAHTAEVAVAIARELRAMDFDLDFAPVADVDSNPNNPIIGDRSFGERPADVARHVSTFIRAMQAEGVLACAKHFPGHGDTAVDSHLALPVVEREERDLLDTELPPFRAAVDADVASIMTAHIVFPALDEDNPATLSPVVLPRLLRDRLGYDGLVFTDDLDMRAVADRWGADALVRGATAASADILLACADVERQVALFEALVRAQEEDPRFHKACLRSVRRLDAVRRRLDRRPSPPLAVIGHRDHRLLADIVRQRGA
jgi:beta-N-acetylhexosaminidase